jgi:hypothetical protein
MSAVRIAPMRRVGALMGFAEEVQPPNSMSDFDRQFREIQPGGAAIAPLSGCLIRPRFSAPHSQSKIMAACGAPKGADF